MVAGTGRSRAATVWLLVLSLLVNGILVGGTAAGEPAVDTATPAGRRAADPIAHDPTVIRQGRYFYGFGTGDAATGTLTTRRNANGTTVLVVGDRGQPTPASQWRLETAADGTYHLINQDGWTASTSNTQAPQQFRLLLP